jgi:pimeloyl-ACP methyl ester carboxylesterase
MPTRYQVGALLLFVDMSTVEQLRAVASVAAQLPAAVLRRGCHSVCAQEIRNVRHPVVLVHGYAGTDAVWSSARRALNAAGFGFVVSLRYNSFATDPGEVSAEVTRLALRAADDAEAAGVHLVGHSLGGLIVRRAVTESPALAALATTAVTIASPHAGTPLARIAPGRCARIMHPVRPLQHSIGGPTHNPRWLAYYSDCDRIVAPASARLDDGAHPATNVLIPGCGHLTICRDPRLLRSLVSELIRTECSPTAAEFPAAAA